MTLPGRADSSYRSRPETVESAVSVLRRRQAVIMATRANPSPHAAGTRRGARRARPRRARGLATFMLIAVTGPGMCLGAAACSNGSAKATPKPTATASTPTVSPLTGIGTAGRVLAVKIDNVGSAQRRQVGLNSADLVYVIEVEGGLSRYLA